MIRYAPLLFAAMLLPGQPMLRSTEPDPPPPVATLVGFVPGVGRASDVVVDQECSWMPEKRGSTNLIWSRRWLTAGAEFGVTVGHYQPTCPPPTEAQMREGMVKVGYAGDIEAVIEAEMLRRAGQVVAELSNE